MPVGEICSCLHVRSSTSAGFAVSHEFLGIPEILYIIPGMPEILYIILLQLKYGGKWKNRKFFSTGKKVSPDLRLIGMGNPYPIRMTTRVFRAILFVRDNLRICSYAQIDA
jgi:hypothetical protein